MRTPFSARSVSLNGGSVVVGIIDGILLIFTITFMASALGPAFARQYWVLGLLLSLVSLGLVVVFALTIAAAAESHSESGERRDPPSSCCLPSGPPACGRSRLSHRLRDNGGHHGKHLLTPGPLSGELGHRWKLGRSLGCDCGATKVGRPHRRLWR